MAKKAFDAEKLVRPNCKGFEPYIAGKPIETIKRELGLKRVIKLASNENPLGPSPRAVKSIKNGADNVFLYPDSNSYNLKKAISSKFKIGTENIILGSGSDEIIELLGKAFFNTEDEIVVSENAFVRYEMAGRLMGCKVVRVPSLDFTHNLDEMSKAVNQKTKAVFIANPNNPTGTYNTQKELLRFLEKVSSFEFGLKGYLPLIVVDEAYFEYANIIKDYPKTVSMLPKYPNLVILRTFSKIYGLAGLRVGYGFAGRKVVDYIDRIRPPFNVNIIAQIAAIESLKDKSQVSRSLKLVAYEKKCIYRELKRIGLPYVQSAGNFILIEVSPYSGKNIFKKLLRKGVIVRAMDEYGYPYHIRVSIGLKKENELFVSGLKSILKEK